MTYSRNRLRLRRRAFTLIEITLVLVVGLGLMTGGVIYFTGLFEKMRVNEVSLGAMQLRMQIPDYAKRYQAQAVHQGHWKTAAQHMVSDLAATDPNWKIVSNDNSGMIMRRGDVQYIIFTNGHPDDPGAGSKLGIAVKNNSQKECTRFFKQVKDDPLMSDPDWSIRNDCSRGARRYVFYSYDRMTVGN